MRLFCRIFQPMWYTWVWKAIVAGKWVQIIDRTGLFFRLSPPSRRQRKPVKIGNSFKVPKVKYSSEEENPSDSLNFDSNFPWEDSDASLVKYDSLRSYRPSQGQVGPLKEKQSTESSIDEAFKSGEFLGWEPARRRGNSEQEVLTKTLCFCCDEEKEAEEKAVFLSSDFSHRRKRTLKIQDVHQSQQVLKHKEYIHDSLTCLDQEPIGNVQFSSLDGVSNLFLLQRSYWCLVAHQQLLLPKPPKYLLNSVN